MDDPNTIASVMGIDPEDVQWDTYVLYMSNLAEVPGVESETGKYECGSVEVSLPRGVKVTFGQIVAGAKGPSCFRAYIGKEPILAYTGVSAFHKKGVVQDIKVLHKQNKQ